MVSIVSDSPHIEKAFHNLIDSLKKAGSGFHSHLTIEASQESIRMSMRERMRPNREMIRIPRMALMPGDQYSVNLLGDTLSVDYYVNSTLSDMQRRIIDQMFEIYNLTHKVEEHKEICFLYSLRDAPTLMEKLIKNRFPNRKYEMWFSQLQNGMTDQEYKSFMVDTFIQTRPLGYTDPIRQDSLTTIMPVIDFLNHHWDGASFAVVSGARPGDLAINVNQCIEDTMECYAFYGVLDACDSLFRYNFVDVLAPVVRSIELELDLPDGRKMVIGNAGNKAEGRESLPDALSDLVLYTPTFKFDEQDGKEAQEQDLKLSFALITLTESKAPLALRRVLKHAIRHMHDAHEMDITMNMNEWVVEAEDKILKVNGAHYHDVLQHAQELLDTKGPSSGVERIKTLAETQLEKIQAYEENIETLNKRGMPA